MLSHSITLNRKYRILRKNKCILVGGGGALNRNNQFVIYLQHNHFSCRYQYSAFFLWDLLLSYPPSNTTMRCKKLKCDFLYYLCDIYIITFIIVNIFTEVLSSISHFNLPNKLILLLILQASFTTSTWECLQYFVRMPSTSLLVSMGWRHRNLLSLLFPFSFSISWSCQAIVGRVIFSPFTFFFPILALRQLSCIIIG